MRILKSKKGVELSLSMVVIAVVLLLVLAVVGFILFKGSNNFQSGVSSCDTNKCVPEASDCQGETPIAVPMKCEMTLNNYGNYCCKSLG